MQPYSFLSLGLLLLLFGSCRSGLTGDLQPMHTAAIETIQASTMATATDISNPNSLGDHGYSLQNIGGGKYEILSRSCAGQTDLQKVLEISIGVQQKLAAIRDNKLDLELARQDRLSLLQIFHSVCYNKKTSCDQIKSVVMNIVDAATRLYVESYRIINSLSSEQVVKVKTNQLDWEVFFPTVYYEDATKMIPGAKADETLIKEQRRDPIHSGYIAVIAEVMMISFKQLA